MAIVPMSNTIEAIDVAVFKYNKYGMEIGGPEGRVYKLACESEDDLNSWIRTFRRVLPNNVVAKSSDLKAKAVPQPRERLARDSMMQWCSGVTDGATDSDDEGAGAEAGGSEMHLPTPIRWSEPGPPPVADESVPRCYLIVFHIAKKHNIGTLIRSACAFGVTEVILCGRKEMNTFGAQGTVPYLRFVHFSKLAAAKDYLAGMGVKVLGVEITPDSLPLQQLLPTLPQPGRDPLPGMPRLHHVAFLLGNEGTGLSSEHLQICDHCVYIPQYGRGTASLNVATSAGIVLHHFALWAGLQEQQRQAQKFVVQEDAKVQRSSRPSIRAGEGVAPKEEPLGFDESVEGMGGMFGEEEEQ
jgi:tRNA G18 (ribose-2'-O)-methylase SpoU